MTAYKDLSKNELKALKKELTKKFEDVKAKGLKLDMSRGKPSTEQLNLSMGMMDVLTQQFRPRMRERALTAGTTEY